MQNKRKRLFTMAILLIVIGISYVVAVPVAPTVTLISNSTKTPGSGGIVNYTSGDASTPDKAGGYIYTVNLVAVSQNDRWKAYVGNVSGKLTLDDADDYTIYDWTVTTSISGEVYATRSSGSITWSDINCSNLGNISLEEIAMNHTSNPNDNISATFNAQDNEEFYVGNVKIEANDCWTTNTYVNDSASVDNFEEALLHDGSNLVYATIIEQDEAGYRNQTTYDFQMILPEKGISGWSSATAYYFFVELT